MCIRDRGFNELSIAGALRKKPVRMAKCRTIDEYAIANAEFVIEGELVAGKRMREDINTNTGKAMPEFPGYTGHVSGELPVIKIKAVTHRKNPIIQTCIGPSEEHVSMAGIPTEASILTMEEKDVYKRQGICLQRPGQRIYYCRRRNLFSLSAAANEPFRIGCEKNNTRRS